MRYLSPMGNKAECVFNKLYVIDPCWCCRSMRTDYRQREVYRRTAESFGQAAVHEYFSTDTCRVEIQDDSSAPWCKNRRHNHKDELPYSPVSHTRKQSKTLRYLPHILKTQQHERTYSQARFHPCPRPATDFQDRL
jgi:hypothetical protein